MAYHFGDCVVDEAARCVTVSGGLVHLSPKGFDLLVLLIRERPRVVATADLHRRLWPDTYVSDASLAMLVSEVRAALGESARRPNAIRTVHRRGYAFQADVREGPAELSGAAIRCWLVTDTRQMALTRGENMVGRDPKATVWLDAPGVSRRHARIVINAAGAVLEDLGSKNGTRLRGRLLTAPEPLTDGAAVTFGPIAAVFRTWQAEPTATEGDR